MFASIKTVSDLSAVSQLSQLAGPHVSEAATQRVAILKMSVWPGQLQLHCWLLPSALRQLVTTASSRGHFEHVATNYGGHECI